MKRQSLVAAQPHAVNGVFAKAGRRGGFRLHADEQIVSAQRKERGAKLPPGKNGGDIFRIGFIKPIQAHAAFRGKTAYIG